MNEKIIEYIRAQLSRNRARLRPYVFPNANSTWRHPSRYAYIRISKYLTELLQKEDGNNKRWVIIPGISGTGKTTILAQLYLDFFTKVEANRIIYISLDDVSVLGSSLSEVLSSYESILGESFESTQKPTIILLDEVHRDPEWATVLSSLYNRSSKIITICSGSSAVSLQTNAADVGRRAIFEKLYPLSFGEFLMIKKNKFADKGLKDKIKIALYGSDSAAEAYAQLIPLEKRVNNYWADIEQLDVDEFLTTGTLPYTIGIKDKAEVFRGLDVQLDKIIDKDIRDLGRFDSSTLDAIKRILYLLADGDQTSVTNISNILGMNRLTVESVLEVLAKAELVIRVAPYGAAEKKVRQPSKYLFMSPALRMTLLDVTGAEGVFLARKGKLLEDVAGMHFYREFVSTGRGILNYDSAEAGADFILQIDNSKQFVIEIGMGQKTTKQVEATMKKHKVNYGIVVCDCDRVRLAEDKNIVMIPKELFLCM